MKIKYIALMLSGLVSFNVIATDYQPSNVDNTFLNDPFFKDSKIILSTKNYWKYLKEEDENPKTVHNGWGQGFAAAYQSGYFANFIGFNAEFYTAMKLAASDNFASRGVLYNKGTAAKKSNAGGYSKFGQRYIKLKANMGDAAIKSNIGWHTMKNFGIISNTTRLSPTTYEGYSATLDYGTLNIKAAYITRSMERDTPKKKKFISRDKKHDIDYIYTGDVVYKADNFNAEYAYGESQDYLRRQIFIGNYKPVEKLNLGTQLYFTKSLDNYKKMTLDKRYFDNHANHFAFDAKWQEDRWSAKLGIGYTHAPKSNGQLGIYHRHMSSNSRSTFISMAAAGEDYLRDGETVFSTIIDYKLRPDLTLGLTTNYGRFDYKHTTVRTGEFNLFTQWTPTDNSFKGLTIWGMIGPGWSYKGKNKTPVLRDGKAQMAHFMAGEFIAEYRFNLL